MSADDDQDARNGKDDRDVRAAEYVLGTLDPDERADAQMLIAADPDFVTLVRKWERRLGELNVLVAPVEPPGDTWDRIKARIAGAPPSTVEVPKVEPREPAPPAVEKSADVIDLTRRLRRWRGIAVSVGTIAAAFAAVVVAREFRPDLLPAQIRPKPLIQVVEKPVEVPSPRPAQYVAVLQKDAASPAFLLTFDLDRHTLAVRRVGAEKQEGKSYELWLISDKFSGPQSLGLIGTEEYTVRPEPASYDAVTVSGATYAVSLEPEGGSPQGTPTGPVLFTGKLIQATPRGFDLKAP